MAQVRIMNHVMQRYVERVRPDLFAISLNDSLSGVIRDAIRADIKTGKKVTRSEAVSLFPSIVKREPNTVFVWCQERSAMFICKARNRHDLDVMTVLT